MCNYDVLIKEYKKGNCFSEEKHLLLLFNNKNKRWIVKHKNNDERY